MKFKYILLTVALATTFSISNADAGFGGSRGGFSGGSRSSSFGGSRSAPSRPSYSAPSKSSSFGGNRSSSLPAPIVRRSAPSTSYSSSGGTTVTHNYYGGNGGYYGGSGNGFFHGMMLGYLWNRPQTVYVGGQTVAADVNSQPTYDSNGQPVVYENSHPFLTFLGTLFMLLVLGFIVYVCYQLFKRG